VGERRFLAAVVDDTVVGRIAIFRTPNDVRFGLFEVSPDHLDAAGPLIDAAKSAAREWGAREIFGPVSIDALYSMGVMTSGFEWVAPIFVDHSRPEYATVLEAIDGAKFVDFQSWRWKTSWTMPAPARQIAAATRVHPGLKLRAIRRDEFDAIEAPVLAELHADAYRETFAYQPLDAKAISWMLRSGDAIDPRCSSIVEIDGEPAAAVVATPNINEIGLTAAEQDRPWASLHDRVVKALKTPKSVRVFMFGLRQAYRGAAVGGLATLLWEEFSLRARAADYERAETPVVPGNSHRSNGLKSIGLRPAHSYRLFTYEVEE
jgi:hypothetical protein